MKGMYTRFENLRIWQTAREFRKEIYSISKKFPKHEQFNLISQIQKAAVSITANIAEGHGRYHYQSEIQFLRMSRGSLNEVLDHLYAALDEAYISQSIFDELYKKGRLLERSMNAYIRSLQGKKEESAD